MKKRLRTLAFTFLTLLSFLLVTQLTATASDNDVAYPVDGGNIYFSNATGMITGSDPYVTAVTVPSEIDGTTVIGIGNNAFHDCAYLNKITLSEGITEIGSAAFSGCESLKNVTLPSSLQKIGYGAFQRCTALSELQLPETLTYIGSRAFYQCESLKSIAVPNGVTSIEQWTFRGCKALTSITLPESLTAIGDSAFNDCISLNDIALPQNLTEIGEWAFYHCICLQNVSIPAAVNRIGECAFYDCKSLQGIWVDSENEHFSSDSDGVLFNKDKTLLIQAPGALTGEYVVTDGVVIVGKNAFRDCVNLSGVKIPNSVTLLGEAAFSGCSALSEVKISESLSIIPKRTFQYCDALTSVTIPASVAEIRDDAFFGCEKLRNVCFFGAAPQIGNTVFSLCHNSLTLFYVEGQEGWIPNWNGYSTTIWDGEHSYSADITLPTCTEQGYTTHTCRICQDSYIDAYTAPTGHDATIESGFVPTCTESGLSDGVICINCDAILQEQTVLPPLGHEFDGWQEINAPDCTSPGMSKRVCFRCNETEIKQTDALGHTYQDGICTRCGANDPDYVIPSADFKDVSKDAWYKSAVDYAVDKGLMNGMGNNTFEPDTPTNRAMLVTVLWRYAGSPVDGTNTFSDVPNGQWYTQAVAWAAKNGIVSGMGNNKFEPDGTLTREQLATILFRYAKLQNLDTSARADFSKFEDGKKVQSWSKDAVQWAVAEGIIGGTTENGKLYLDPQGNATRAQVATILMRFIENVLKK